LLTKGEKKKNKAKKEPADGHGNLADTAESDGVLFFFSEQEASAFAKYAAENRFEVEHFTKKNTAKELAKIAKKAFNPSISGLDIALFGRMVAKAPDMNIEAAASFSHAISTHKISNEIEFFTALDDLAEEPGSAHMGSLEYNSATYYRYVSLDLWQLGKFFGADDIDALHKALDAFTRALFLAIPSARQTSQSGACPWEFARVMVRTGQRLQCPFETEVKARDGGFLLPSIEALKGYLDKKEQLSGSLFGKIASYDWGEEDGFTIDHLSERLQSHITALV
jgi:CRISPR system Cascade subunit CasC